MRRKAALIINFGAGSAGSERIADVKKAFESSQVDLTIHQIGPNEAIDDVLRAAASSEADILVAGGGDGTVSAVAAAAVESGKILGVLPLGTLNHFSKDLKIPQEIQGAVRVIDEGFERSIDLAQVNGRYFINNSSIGLYPRLVKGRERGQRLGHGKWWAAVWALLRLPRWSPFQTVNLEFEGNRLARKTPFVFVGNNTYEMELYNIGTRARLDEGRLSVYLLRRSGRTGLFLLILRTIVGGLRQSENFEEFHTGRVTIETDRRNVLVAMDGEVATIEPPLEYRIHPGKLRVLAPRDKE